MAFMFLPVVLAVFLINFGTAFAEKNDNCIQYDDELPNGKKKIDLYHDCGITDVKTINNEENSKCLAKAFKVVNEDGSINGEKLKSEMKGTTNPEYTDDLQKAVDKILKESPEDFYSRFPKEVAKICPKDQIYGNPDA